MARLSDSLSRLLWRERAWKRAPHLVAACMGMLALGAFANRLACAADRNAVAAAANSITAGELKRHVEVLADDSFEGREAGSRGGYAAAVYLAREFQRHKLHAAGNPGSSYFQPFFGNCRNILGAIEGSDARLKQEYVLVGAHYDHVGYGNQGNSNGPTGYIHNGADDNASGVATMLEMVEAMTKLGQSPQRSVLFALWDSEENGLNGSQHWMNQSTVPVRQVTATINLDMIGRLRHDRLEIYGARTGRGLRRLLSEQNRGIDLVLDFKWDMRDDSDHYTFYQAGLPAVMIHTGLHEDYHRPSDDAPKVNAEGMRRVGQLVFRTVVELADAPERQRFRARSRQESSGTQAYEERVLAPSPSRLGVRWSNRASDQPGAELVEVKADGPAARAGLRPGDRITYLAGVEIEEREQFPSLVLAAANPAKATVIRPGVAEPLNVTLSLRGSPVRIGLAWRVDDAEPTAVQLTRIVPGSPAAEAGLHAREWVYQVNGHDFRSSDEFAELLKEGESLELLVESWGRLRTATVKPLEALKSE